MTSLPTPGSQALPGQDLHTLNAPDLLVDIVISVTTMGRVSPGKMMGDLITQSADNNNLTDYWDNQAYPRYQGGLQCIAFISTYYAIYFLYFT